MKILTFVLCFTLLGSTLRAAEFGELFGDETLTIYIRDQKTGTDHVYNAERSKNRFTAYSTFKIPNSLIALETGVVESISDVFKFNPEKHKSPFRPEPDYNRDQTLESAFKVSALWTYQEIAKRIGKENYQKHLEVFEYGNKDVSGDIGHFWLNPLKISAAEQVRFLTKFHNNDLNLKTTTVDTVKKLMLLKEEDGYKLYGKTGTGTGPDRKKWTGWLVGFVEANDNVYFFALNIDAKSYKEIKAQRMHILMKSFHHLGVPMEP